jgi:hypothetical protein
MLNKVGWMRLPCASLLAAFLLACGSGGGSDSGAGNPNVGPPPTVGQCANRYPAGFALVSGTDNLTNLLQTSVGKPARGSVFEEPAFKTCAVRVTSHATDGLSGFARHDYSRRQAFNADSSLMLVYALDGSWNVYNANTYAFAKRLSGPAGDAEPQWDPTDPDVLYYLPTNGGLVVNKLVVSSNTSSVIGNFSGRLPWAGAARMWTKSEGSPSADGRYWAFMVETSGFSPLGFVVWDRFNDQIVSSRANSIRPDHLSMSASGNYVVVSWNDGVVAFTRDFASQRPLNVLGEHSDIALDANGDDLYVSVDYQAGDGAVYMINLRTGARTDLFPTYLNDTATALHISGKAFRRPGWVVLSTYAEYSNIPGQTGREWLHAKVMAVELKANPKVHHLAHHRSVDDNDPTFGSYFTEPQASVNRDFTKIVFNSNWGIGAGLDIEAYMVELPLGLIP